MRSKNRISLTLCTSLVFLLLWSISEMMKCDYLMLSVMLGGNANSSLAARNKQKNSTKVN